MNNMMNEEEFYKIYDKSIYNYNYFRIQELKKYLQDTDYIVIKMYEKAVQGGNIIELLKECKEILSKREEARKKINELEESI